MDKPKPHRGQSLLELALALPIILLLLAGLVEVGFFINRYLTLLDLTREAARFASVRDPFSTVGDSNCSSTGDLNFYYDTACAFSPPGPPPCAADGDPSDCSAGSFPAECDGMPETFCNGFNSDLPLDLTHDDIVVTVFTIHNYVVVARWPDADGWELSEALDADGSPENWKQDCKGNVDTGATPFFSNADVNALLNPNAPPDKALVIAEAYYCYWQTLNLPILSQALPNPIKLHVYTIMPTVQPPRCRDLIDNDGDTFVDLADPQCLNADDNDEAN